MLYFWKKSVTHSIWVSGLCVGIYGNVQSGSILRIHVTVTLVLWSFTWTFILILKHYQGPENIICSCISPCGGWIAYSTASRFFLYRLNYENDTISLQRVSDNTERRNFISVYFLCEVGMYWMWILAQWKIIWRQLLQNGCSYPFWIDYVLGGVRKCQKVPVKFRL